jgi:hypothetical protein
MAQDEKATRNRRVEERFETYVAVEIEGQGKTARFGVTRDASSGGMLVATPSRFDVGTELTLRLHDTNGPQPDAAVKAIVVRVDETDLNSDEPWRYRLAVRFEDPEAAAIFLAERKGTIPPPHVP